MLKLNPGLLKELESLEKGGFTGQHTIHWSKGVAKIVDYPKKPIRKEISNDINNSELKK